MKLILDARKYYRKNKKIVKLQGIIFMLLGLIILGLIIYGTISIYQIAIFATQTDYIDEALSDCKENVYFNKNMDNVLEKYNFTLNFYESKKYYYYNTTDIDTQLKTFEIWDSTHTQLVDAFNDIVNEYNIDPNYYGNCYSSTLSQDIEDARTYVSKQQDEIDEEYEILSHRAESAGYYYVWE